MADVVNLRPPHSDRFASANRRASILGALLEIVAVNPEGAEFGYIHSACLVACEATEEEIGPDIQDSAFCLVLSGLVICNTYDAASATLTINADTKLTPSMRLNDFAWGHWHLTKSEIPI